MSRKRARTSNVVRAARRPIDKNLVCVNKSAIGASQVSTTIRAAVTFPSTLTGLRWSLNVFNNAGTAETQCFWAIAVVPQGTTASTLAFSDAATLYSPEKNVLTFGMHSSLTSVGAQGHMFEGSTKTMRKLQVGDTVVFIAIAEATNTWSALGVVQYFLKT